MAVARHRPLRALPVLQEPVGGDARTAETAPVQTTDWALSDGGGGSRLVDHLPAYAPPSERSLLDAEKVAEIAPLLALLAPLVEYPTRSLAGQVLACRVALEPSHAEAAAELGAFLEWLINEPVERTEETYTRTFYLAPVCIPYVSVHIFGDESFQRGDLMAKLRDHFERLGFDPGPELPDHLAVLLRFAERLTDDERAELVAYCLGGPVARMDDQIAKTSNPYRHAVRAIRLVVAPPVTTGA